MDRNTYLEINLLVTQSIQSENDKLK